MPTFAFAVVLRNYRLLPNFNVTCLWWLSSHYWILQLLYPKDNGKFSLMPLLESEIGGLWPNRNSVTFTDNIQVPYCLRHESTEWVRLCPHSRRFSVDALACSASCSFLLQSLLGVLSANWCKIRLYQLTTKSVWLWEILNWCNVVWVAITVAVLETTNVIHIRNIVL